MEQSEIFKKFSLYGASEFVGFGGDGVAAFLMTHGSGGKTGFPEQVSVALVYGTV